MAGLAKKVVPGREAERIHAGQEMQQRIQEAAGIFRGSEVRGLNSNDAQPDEGRDPFFPGMDAGWTQERASRTDRGSCTGLRNAAAIAPLAENIGGDPRVRAGARWLLREPGRRGPGDQPSSGASLRRIVWRLARDHDIVDMALAQSGDADADEARLLQQFRNGGAAAVSHP